MEKKMENEMDTGFYRCMHAAEEEFVTFSAFYLLREHALPIPTPCADEQVGLCFRHVRDPWP